MVSLQEQIELHRRRTIMVLGENRYNSFVKPMVDVIEELLQEVESDAEWLRKAKELLEAAVTYINHNVNVEDALTDGFDVEKFSEAAQEVLDEPK